MYRKYVIQGRIFKWHLISLMGFPGGSVVKNLPASAGDTTWVRSLGWEDPPEKDKATHSCTFAGIIPRTEETCGLQSMGSQRVGHDWTTEHEKRTQQHYFSILRKFYIINLYIKKNFWQLLTKKSMNLCNYLCIKITLLQKMDLIK